jgi:hypothetical protein
MSVLQWAELDLGGTAELIRGGVAGVSVNNSPYVVSPSSLTSLTASPL